MAALYVMGIILAVLLGMVIQYVISRSVMIWVVLYKSSPLKAFYDIVEASNYMDEKRRDGTNTLQPGWEGYVMREVILK